MELKPRWQDHESQYNLLLNQGLAPRVRCKDADAVANLLPIWEVAKTDFTGCSKTSNKCQAHMQCKKAQQQANCDAAAGNIEMEQAAENYKPASSSGMSRPALPILEVGGSLLSLHVACVSFRLQFLLSSG